MKTEKFWRGIVAVAVGLLFFVLFSAGYGLFIYLRPSKFTSAITPKDFGVEYETVNLMTADRVKLASWYIPSQTKTNQAILLLHGYPADKGDILESMIFLHDNYNLLFLDFRYFGGSEGHYSAIGIKEVNDVLAGVKYLKERGNTKVGVWGFSMGAACALMSLSYTQDIKAVVSETSYASLALMAEEVYRQVPVLNKLIAGLMIKIGKVFLRIDVIRQSPLEAVRNSSVPILFIHSQDDEVIPFSHALLLQQAAVANPQAQFWFREESGHGFLGSKEYNTRLIEFFQKSL